ncbi:MAG TPA: LysE family translocator [Hyphomonadaceae bacterium]|nr:LysE family translocator [Hyphomonadaceae bacterium]
MDVTSALIAYCVAAGLLTVTPGLDTALVLRTATVEGSRRAAMAAGGIVAGCLVWGLAAAVGLGVLLAASETAYAILKIAGALYLLWLGFGMLRSAFRKEKLKTTDAQPPRGNWFVRGFVTNLLNPKVGVFYVSFLPQFVPAGVNTIAFSMLLAAIHAIMGIAWFALLILATRGVAKLLDRPVVKRAMDSVTGTVMMLFGAVLLLERRTT